jgi:hypothetical protein
MANLRMVCFLMIVVAAMPCNGRSAPDAEGSVRLRLMGGRPVADDVFINAQGPYCFLLDTGAQTNQIEPSLARKLGLAPSFQVEMVTPAGSVRVPGGRVREVSLGLATASNQEFLFTPLDSIHALSSEIQGVLGQEFLTRFDYLFDFVNQRVVFDPPIPARGRRVNFEMIHGRAAIQTREGKMVLDSGANTAILFRSPSSSEKRQIQTVSGSASASLIQDLRLHIAGREYRPAHAVAMSKTDQIEDGVVPVCLFRAILFSNSGRYAILDPSL